MYAKVIEGLFLNIKKNIHLQLQWMVMIILRRSIDHHIRDVIFVKAERFCVSSSVIMPPGAK